MRVLTEGTEDTEGKAQPVYDNKNLHAYATTRWSPMA